MSYLKERVAYLKGLAEGMQIDDSTNERKLLNAIINVLDDMALSVSDIEEEQNLLGEQVDSIDEDLAEIERVIFDDNEDECSDSLGEFDCPYCNKAICLDEDSIDEDDEVECPHCHEKIKINWECGCDDCSDEESN
jgi:DNA-directed RNA polymerase subunit RPC12/RpoP